MKNLTDPLDSQGDASRLLRRYADCLLVIQHRDHHELLSLDDNGATWSKNPTQLWDWHREAATGHAAAVAVSDVPAAEIRAATGYLRRARTQRGFMRMMCAVGAAFLQMQESGDIPPGLTWCPAEDLDREPLYLGCANGVVDLNAGYLLPAEDGRRQLISRNTGVAFDPEARDSSVDEMLVRLSAPERHYLLAALSHALRGGSPGRWYVLCGVAGSGKGTFLRTIADAVGVVQSGGYAFYLDDRMMISGRHTSTTRFADHLLDFTRGRIALGDALPLGSARLNRTLLKTLTGRDPLPSRGQRGLDGVRAPVTATIFQAMLPEDIDHLDFSDPALVDRTHVLSCLLRDGRTIGAGLANAPNTDQARQAMLALLVQHAVENREPPFAPASVTQLLRERRRTSIGAVGRWLLDHLQVTGGADETVLADEIMVALAEDIPPDDQARFQGRSRREVLALARDLIDRFPAARRVKRGGRLLSAYAGLRLITAPDIDLAGAAFPADIEAQWTEAVTLPAYTIEYCRACRRVMLGILQKSHLTDHTVEELRRQHPCLRCNTPLPAGDPFQLLCADCEGTNVGDFKTQAAVLESIAAEMENPDEGMAAYLQAQVDLVQQVLQGIREEGMKEDDNPEGENGAG